MPRFNRSNRPKGNGRQFGRPPFRSRVSPSRDSASADSDKKGWQPVANWYASYLSNDDTFQKAVVFPGALRLLAPRANATYLDIACGEGSFAEMLVEKRAKVIGFDIAPNLVARARDRQLPGATFLIGDAQHFAAALRPQKFAGATCILAIQNIRDCSAVFRDAAAVLEPGAPLVIVLNHPAFRIPRQSDWGWDDEKKIMYRRIDRYLSPLDIPIRMNPGSDRRAAPIITTSYHRPLETYVTALANAGFALDGLEEWTSHHISDSGPRAKAENRAREEFPLFLAIRARKMA